MSAASATEADLPVTDFAATGRCGSSVYRHHPSARPRRAVTKMLWSGSSLTSIVTPSLVGRVGQLHPPAHVVSDVSLQAGSPFGISILATWSGSDAPEQLASARGRATAKKAADFPGIQSPHGLKTSPRLVPHPNAPYLPPRAAPVACERIQSPRPYILSRELALPRLVPRKGGGRGTWRPPSLLGSEWMTCLQRRSCGPAQFDLVQ